MWLCRVVSEDSVSFLSLLSALYSSQLPTALRSGTESWSTASILGLWLVWFSQGCDNLYRGCFLDVWIFFSDNELRSEGTYWILHYFCTSGSKMQLGTPWLYCMKHASDPLASFRTIAKKIQTHTPHPFSYPQTNLENSLLQRTEIGLLKWRDHLLGI